jgi:hypothetical protein
MSRAPKRIWWCPNDNIFRNKNKCSWLKSNGKCCGMIKCTAKPYVPEKGGERCSSNAKSVE